MKKLLLGFALSLSLVSALLGAAASLPSIPFATSQAQFANGDSITIQEVLASSPTLEPGVTFIVRGTYTLQSADAAILGISLTTTTTVSVPSQPTARRQIARGTATFEMEYTIQFAGSVYLALSPATGGGNSFGRIYVAGTQSSGGGGTPTTPTTPRPPHVPPPINTEGLISVPFSTSRAQFAAGDGITLETVLASSPRMKPGDTVVVRGRYALQSRTAAELMVSLTENAAGFRRVVSPSAHMTVSVGTGTFELAYQIQQPGALHVSFYPTETGSSFGGVYFAPPGGGPFTSAAVALAEPPENSGKLGNLAVRSLVGAGDATLIAGVTVTDEERYVLIRGVGPSLAALGVSGVLRKPVLSVYAANGELIATTASWSAAFSGDQRTGIEMVMRSVGAFPLAAGSEDAVLNLRLVPGGYTVSLSSADGQSGVGLLEVYASSTFSLPAPR